MKVFRRALIAGIFLLSMAPIVSAADATPRVLNGIDVLRQQEFAPLAGKRVGLITNHTGVAADGRSTIDLLFNSGVCRLVALFSPEHGIRGILDSKVSSSIDDATGLPVYSLYGDTRRPTSDMLVGIDGLIFDIQDIGARFYTYGSTMAYAMEEAAKAKIPFYVLDRPNPIGGVRVEGPMLDPDKTSFLGYLPLPVRHGMTIGELARYFNAQNKIGADLRVIEMRGWQRAYYFYDTEQLWVNPSPNMRGIVAAILYPGVCLLERTNVSVGRGTERPFEVVGAPWIEPKRLAIALEKEQLRGVKFVPQFFTPNAGPNQGVRCGGIGLVLTEPERVNTVLLGLSLISNLYRLYPDKFQIGNVIDLLGNDEALKELRGGMSPAQVLRAGAASVQQFMAKRQEALIYGRSGSKEGIAK